jgi:hypothetical protein
MLHQQSRLRIQLPRRSTVRVSRRQRAASRPEVRFVEMMLGKFRLRHNVLLGRYERAVKGCDVLEARRDALARQIRSLERAIDALERYPQK